MIRECHSRKFKQDSNKIGKGWDRKRIENRQKKDRNRSIILFLSFVYPFLYVCYSFTILFYSFAILFSIRLLSFFYSFAIRFPKFCDPILFPFCFFSIFGTGYLPVLLSRAQYCVWPIIQGVQK